ncbi:hypothetical protein A9G34_09920 [Gilliamella sp. Choc4-2]|uniref:hypothetical protein n=1 Tax=unclassified Gilliamella TaxID=2685620 RepID=UPI00080DAB0E|nr:hypothetical protein [Gilliamella apicola]OCG30555.1 hypothetical protein A9G33_07630 [Gilliamella apicola]OCG43034.1 hypothetical protein A9G34_09920 [Gilliamella apicola]OCG54010.1 hypothetical protein A9G36_08935 [Gilliamella apicola]
MWLFWLYEFLGFIGVILLIAVYCHFCKQSFWAFVWQYLKWVGLAILVVWLIIAILCRQDLYSATHCYFRGVSMHANTKYSIYLGECQVETRNGSYVPIDRSRALPGSSDHENTIDNGAEELYY